jgi:hypothetical protein
VDPGSSAFTTPFELGNGVVAGGVEGVLVAQNGNVYTRHEQFYRLPNCGAMAFISDMQIVIQGCPVEEIHRYNIMASYLHDIVGIPDCKDKTAMQRYFADGKPFVAQVDSYSDWISATAGNVYGGQYDDTHTGKPLQTSNILEMRIGVTYRAFLPMMSGLLGVLAHTYFPSMLVATGTMTIELTVANATQVCVCTRPTGGIANNANPGYFYPSQQQILGNATQNFAGAADACVSNSNTARGMLGWTEAQLNSVTLAVNIKSVAFVANQIILPDTICTAVISRAASSDISVMTSSIRAYATDIDSATGNVNANSRSILVPV